MKLRYVFLLILILGLCFFPALNQKSYTTTKYFYRYFRTEPVVWKPKLPMCVEYMNKPEVYSENFSRELLNEFKALSKVSAFENCRKSNVYIEFGKRTTLSYLLGNNALAATLVKYDPLNPQFIIGAEIQVDTEAFKNLQAKTRKALILHELGHVLGFTHSLDGYLMNPVINYVKEEKYSPTGMLMLVSKERLLK